MAKEQTATAVWQQLLWARYLGQYLARFLISAPLTKVYRNWDIQWSIPVGASTDPCAQTYKVSIIVRLLQGRWLMSL